MTAQKVIVDLRKGEYTVNVYAETVDSLWVLDGTPERVSGNATAIQLGTIIDNALALSRSGLPELTRDSQPARPLLDLLGVRNYATYMKGTRSVDVRRDSDAIRVTPNRNEGARGGFTPIVEERVRATALSAEQLGAEVLRAFTKAT